MLEVELDMIPVEPISLLVVEEAVLLTYGAEVFEAEVGMPYPDDGAELVVALA